MSYATILVHLDASRNLHERLHLAAQLCVQHSAKLIGVFAVGAPDPMAVRGLADGDRYLSTFNEWQHRKGDDARQAFEGATADLQIRTEWRAPDWGTEHAVEALSHLADLLVLGEPGPRSKSAIPTMRSLSSVILRCGRPVLVVPAAGPHPTVGQRVTVAWNGSRECARAIHDALPILVRADAIDVIQFSQANDIEPAWHSPPDYAVTWLRSHGVTATVETLIIERSDDAGEMLIDHAQRRQTDLIVMGAFGHTRMREIVLGGVTHTILQSMPAAVLFSH
ncbi:universal stress protein [Cupriavidus pauculus]|uniref:universal stress protein n=1 Tax=Cupriavidus pauculus TaxID=82633 RepID=UPI000A04AA77|nr:universal stress protein [Cupriavidus pauculus]